MSKKELSVQEEYSIEMKKIAKQLRAKQNEGYLEDRMKWLNKRLVKLLPLAFEAKGKQGVLDILWLVES